MRHLIALLLIITLLLTACGGDDSDSSKNTPIPPTATEESATLEPPPSTHILIAENAARDRLLRVSQEGDVMPLFTFSSSREDNRIVRCDEWLDQDALLYIGADRGDLVYYTDGTTVSIGQVTEQGCTSSRRFGSGGVAYLDRMPDQPYGMLNVTAADGPRYTLDHVGAFDPAYDAILALRLYADETDQITTADLDSWNPNGVTNLGVFAALENCALTGGALARSRDGIFTILGQQCAAESTWRMFWIADKRRRSRRDHIRPTSGVRLYAVVRGGGWIGGAGNFARRLDSVDQS